MDKDQALRLALEALEWNYGTDLENIENCMAWLDKMNATIPALRQALAQPVDAVNMSQERVDETAKGEHEPFIYVREDNERPFGGYEHCSEADAGAFPVYTAPPKHEWVGLTDEDKDELLNLDNWTDIVEAVEAKLKEKNT